MSEIMFSVVIPLYNKEAYIKRTIDSVLEQSCRNFELIVVDDGSTDKSHEKVREYTDERIRLIRRENGGECAARNTGIESAKYPYLAFLDADDKWTPDFLATVLQLIEKYPEAGAYVTSMDKVNVRGERKRRKIHGVPTEKTGDGLIENFFKSIAYGLPPIMPSCVCIPKRVFDEVGTFPAGVKRNGETEVWLKVALKYPVAYSPKVCAVYHRDVDDSICNKYLPAKIPFEKIILDAIAQGKIDKESEIYALELLAKMNHIYAGRYLMANKTELARDWLGRVKTIRILLKIKVFALYVLSYLPYPFIKWVGFHFGDMKAEFEEMETLP